jgi:hypothetical protein
LRHFATPEFWKLYNSLPKEVQTLADRCYALMKDNPRHPSIQLKPIGEYWAARVGLHYRTIGIAVPEGISWFWIGSHSAYDRIVG